MLIELKNTRQTILSLLKLVESLEILGKVIENEVFFENRYDVALLVIHYVGCYL